MHCRGHAGRLMHLEPTASDWRAAIGLLARCGLAADVRVRLEHGMRRAADAAGPRPLYAFHPEGDSSWRIGAPGTSARCTTAPQGMLGLDVAYQSLRAAALHLPPPIVPACLAEAKRLRSQLTRAADWIEDECGCEPVADAVRALAVSTRRGLWHDDPGLIKLDFGGGQLV